MHILDSTNVPFTLTTVQMPNLALTHTKRITVKAGRRIGPVFCGLLPLLTEPLWFGFTRNSYFYKGVQLKGAQA
jgi:hypothetical protein